MLTEKIENWSRLFEDSDEAYKIINQTLPRTIKEDDPLFEVVEKLFAMIASRRKSNNPTTILQNDLPAIIQSGRSRVIARGKTIKSPDDWGNNFDDMDAGDFEDHYSRAEPPEYDY